ncbi:MAG: glycosyltransferase family 4 protein [Roseiflexaceae bacterium]|nr:glycosyltransferase family 4 protein [Roseiflexaceae bacterium]
MASISQASVGHYPVAERAPGTALRVAYDITPIDDQPSGVGNYALHLLTHLRTTDAAHEYLPISNRATRSALLPADCGPHPLSRPFPSRMLWMQARLPGELRRIRPQLCHYTNSIGPLANPCPYVVTIHDMTLSLMPRLHQLRKHLSVRPVIALVARRAQRIITVSEYARQEVIRVLRIAPERVVVTPEAAAACFQPAHEDEQRRVRACYRITTPYILYVGTLEPRKNIVRLIRAWHALRRRNAVPHTLVLVGARGWQYEPIFRVIEELGCRDEIIFTGYVPAAHLPALYSAADALMFPSLAEGFGLPLVEAMACGTPVLASLAPALVEIAGGAAQHADGTSVAALSTALEQLLTDRALHQALRARGLQRAAEFSWQRTAQQTLEVYASVVAQAAVWPSLRTVEG